jgi:hypothetical protein
VVITVITFGTAIWGQVKSTPAEGDLKIKQFEVASVKLHEGAPERTGGGLSVSFA